MCSSGRYPTESKNENQEDRKEDKDGFGDEKSIQSTSMDKKYDSEMRRGKMTAPNSPLDLGRKTTSKSKIPVSVSKSNLSEDKKDLGKFKHYSSLQNISDKKMESRSHWGVDLFKKIIHKQKWKQNNAATESVEELYIRDSPSLEINIKDKNTMINTVHLNSENIYLDYSLVEGLKEMVEIGNKIQESETRVKDMIIKYINDKSLEGELLNAICGHGKILLDSERRTLNISSETWFQQAEIYKEQQKSFQNTIDTIIAQNRDLQADYDAVVKKNEKMCAKIIFLQESPEIGLPKNSKNFSNNPSSLKIVEDLNKHNDKLRTRLNCLSSRVEDLEDSLRKALKKSSYLQQQLKNSNILLQNNKTSYERSKNDYELEIAKLYHDVQSSNSAVKEAVEAGDVLLDDLDSMKSQFKCQSKCINWDKFKRRGKSLIDLIHLSRSCINELSKELVNTNNELNVFWQENENLKLDVEQKNITIKKLEDEKDKIQEIVLSCKELEVNLKNVTEKCKSLEAKCKTMEFQNDRQKGEIEEKNRQHMKYEERIKSLIGTIEDKSEALVQLRVESGRLEQERDSLQVQINGMTQVLSASGTGDIAKELAATQEKLSKMQAQYFSTVSDKNILEKQAEAYITERETLITYQKTCYDQMQLLKKDIEALEKTNESLTEQLATEKKTVSALQAERVRHLEERTVLTAIYDRLRSELSKVDELQGAITTMNHRANKFAMIAEYNKKLGKQLQHQVAEKEVTISELQANMKELEDVQVEMIREKVELCGELAQVFSIKESLSDKLDVEKERSAILCESRKEMKTVITERLKEIHGKYAREYRALKSLSKDVKSVVSQRNALEIINEENKHKITSLEDENKRYAETLLKLQKENELLLGKLQQLEEISVNDAETHRENIKSLEDKLALYKETVETMKAMFEPMNSDRERLKECVEYLQADVKNLRAELNHSRETEISYKSLLEKETQQSENLRSDLDMTVKKFQELSERYCENKDQLLSISDSYDELKEEFDLIIEESNRFRLILAEKFATSMKSGCSTPTNITVEGVDASDKDDIIVELQEKNRQLEINNVAFTEAIEALKKQKDDLLKQQSHSQEKLKLVSTSYKESLQKIVNLEDELKSISNQVITSRGYKDDHKCVNKLQNEVCSCDVMMTNLSSEIFHLTSKLDDTTKCCDGTIRYVERLETSLKDVTSKLLNAAQALDEERTSNEGLKVYVNQLESQKEKMEKSITELNEVISNLSKEREALKLLLLKEKNKIESKNDKSTLVDFSIEDEDNRLRIETLKSQLDGKYKEIARLEDEHSTMESRCALLEFQRCESILRLHEVQGKMFSEMARNRELKRNVQSALEDLRRAGDRGEDLSDAYARLGNSLQSLIAAEDAFEAIRETCNECGDEVC